MVSTKIRLIIFLAVKDGEALTVSKNKTWSWLWLRSSAPFCKIQAQIEESRENHYAIQVWPNQIPYDYTVEVTNKFKEIDLVDTVPEELWTEVYNIVQEVVTKTISKRKKCKKAKSEEALQIAEKWRGAKGGKGEKER